MRQKRHWNQKWESFPFRKVSNTLPSFGHLRVLRIWTPWYWKTICDKYVYQMAVKNESDKTKYTEYHLQKGITSAILLAVVLWRTTRGLHNFWHVPLTRSECYTHTYELQYLVRKLANEIYPQAEFATLETIVSKMLRFRRNPWEAKL